MWIYNCICTIILYIYKYSTFFFKGAFNLFASLTDPSLGSNLGNSGGNSGLGPAGDRDAIGGNSQVPSDEKILQSRCFGILKTFPTPTAFVHCSPHSSQVFHRHVRFPDVHKYRYIYCNKYFM